MKSANWSSDSPLPSIAPLAGSKTCAIDTLLRSAAAASSIWLDELNPVTISSELGDASSRSKGSIEMCLKTTVYYGPQGFLEYRGRVGKANRDPITQDKDVAKRLWTLSEELTGQTFAPVGDS